MLKFMLEKYDEYNGNEMIQLTRDKEEDTAGWKWENENTKNKKVKWTEGSERDRKIINRKIQSYIPFYCWMLYE